MSMLARLWNWLKSDERGQGLAEYGLIIILVAVLVVGAMAIFGDSITGLFTRIGAQLSSP
jgi:pilus assembly protein Flp/PilA